ncbi:hypothetical protein glysoja_001501 [Glycine soja]|nr:hypothetical protein glysoja_001501 [Glycine soja]
MESTTQKNKSKKSSLLMRLKPVMGFDDSIMPNRNGDDPVLSYLAIANKDGAVLPAIFSSMFGGAEDLGEKCGCRRRKWQALRAVFSGTTLMRMAIKRRVNKGKLSLTRTTSKLEETNGKISNPKCKSTCRTSSKVSSTFGSSSTLTSSSPSSSISSVRTVSSSSTNEKLSHSIPLNGTHVMKQKQCGVEDKKKGQNYGSNIALSCMLSITLLILILWGKILTILFTSMCLYLVPFGSRRPRNVGGYVEREFESVQSKKVVTIMEGVLGSERSSYGSMSKS